MKSELNTLPAIPAVRDDHILWNQSVKAASMLYHWKLVDSYESILRLLSIHQTYLQQEHFKHDNTFLPQLEEQLPKVDGPRIWACFHIGPYALMARALIRRGYGIAILLKDEVFEEQYPMYMQQFKRSFGREPKASELQFTLQRLKIPYTAKTTVEKRIPRYLLCRWETLPHPSDCSYNGRRQTEGTEQGRPIRKQQGAVFRRYAILLPNAERTPC